MTTGKRTTLASSMPSGAAVGKLRAKFGGGAAVPGRAMVRGSTGWLRNRDAIASAKDTSDQPRQLVRASARFGRRVSAMDQLKHQIVAATSARKMSASVVDAPPPPPPKGKAVKKAVIIKEERPAEMDDGVSDMQRIAWATWHLSEKELRAAGHNPALVRAPKVLAAVRARFLHSPNIMLNSNFDCHFSVDQGAFKRILRRKYGFMAIYMPVNYPGMRCPFLLRRGVPLTPALQTGKCDAEDEKLCTKSKSFLRKYVKATFILFRTGNAFLRGSFSREVMTFVFAQFKRILVDEYPNICTRFTSPDAKDHNSVVKTRTVHFSVASSHDEVVV